MPVVLRQSAALDATEPFDSWLSVDIDGVKFSPSKKRPNLAALLEDAFNVVADDWVLVATKLGLNATSVYAHAPSCTANVSDLGVMMAWSKVVADCAAGSEVVLVVCDDPWLFRHLANKDNVNAGKAPPLYWKAMLLVARGFASRLFCAVRLAFELLNLPPRDKQKQKYDQTALLVYGHPASAPDGHDGYFGNLLGELSDAQRILHVDCSGQRAKQLKGNGQTSSLHEWGSYLDLFSLPFARWRPERSEKTNDWRWLIDRAVAHEGGSGQAAMIRWQQVCQRRWLRITKPACVIWPWENHGWERDFVRAARAVGVRTIGYQHSVVGPQMLNYGARSNADGLASMPDEILCTGKSTLEQLAAWGAPKDRLHIGGALRIPEIKKANLDPDGPIYMALSFDKETAKQMLDAAERLTKNGYRFIVKNHPMQPIIASSNKNIEVTQQAFSAHSNLRALIYAASTVGLEAVIAGLPTIRFQTEGKIALDILPLGVRIVVSDSDGLEKALTRVTSIFVSRDDIFAPVNLDIWKKAINSD